MQVLNRRSPYKNNVRCTRCGIWIRKTELRYNKIGLPICPECGKNVRTKARKKNHKYVVIRNETIINNVNILQTT